MKKETICFIKASKIRRLGSAIIDLLFMIVIAMVFYLGIDSIIKSTDAYKTCQNRYNEIQLQSHLYKENDNNSIEFINENYDDCIISFYSDYVTSSVEDATSKLNDFKRESDLFDDSFKVKDEVTAENINSFYKKTLNSIIKSEDYEKFLENFDDAVEITNKRGAFILISLSLSILFASLLYYVLLPLIKKDHLTLGKNFFHLDVISSHTNVEPTKLQIAFRGLCYIFIEIGLSFTLMMLTSSIFPFLLIISYLITLFNKKSVSIHDFLCQTFVVSSDPIFNNTPENSKIYVDIVKED